VEAQDLEPPDRRRKNPGLTAREARQGRSFLSYGQGQGQGLDFAARLLYGLNFAARLL
jgi:hypothetical protein